MSKIRPKTVKALVEHITQTLPTVNEGYCEPLRLDYLKSLRTVLEYQPHVEHLQRDEWHDLVDFCIEGVKLGQGITGHNSLNLRSAQSTHNGTSTSSSFLAVGSARTRDSGTQETTNVQSRSNAEELVLCLYQLMCAPNAPLLEKAQPVIEVLVEILQVLASTGRAHQTAFATLNQILAKIITNDISLSQQLVQDGVSLVKRFWSAKSASLKDEMLVTLMHGRSYIRKSCGAEDKEIFRAELEGLTEIMQTEYSKRAERDQLQLDDITFLSRCGAQHKPVPLSVAGMHLRFESARSEQSWVLPQALGFLLSVVEAHEMGELEIKTIEDVEGTRKKRRRMVQQLDDLLRRAKNSHLTGRLCALQTIPFFLDEKVATKDEIALMIESLLDCTSDENATIVSWAMIGISRYTL